MTEIAEYFQVNKGEDYLCVKLLMTIKAIHILFILGYHFGLIT